MAKDSSLNFLPDEAKKDANDALKNKKTSQGREMKLVVPTFDKDMANTSSKKSSWWERRKQKKEEKRREKLRRKGETAIKQAQKKMKQETMNASSVNVKPDLFAQSSKETKVVPKPKEEQKKVPVVPSPKPAPKPEMKEPPMPKVRPMEAPKPAKQKQERKEQPKKVSSQKEQQKTKMKEGKTEKPKLSFTAVESDAKQPTMHQPENGNGDGPTGPTVNLVPESARVTEQGQPWILASISLLIFIAIWFVAAGIAVTYVRDVESEVLAKQQELDNISNLISASQKGREASEKLQKQFVAVEQVLENHVYWSPFFENLEATTIPDVYYTRLNVTQTGEVVLRAIGKSYAAAARQIRAFEKAPSFVDSISVNEVVVELQPDSVLPVPIVAFDIELDLADGLLKKDFSTEASNE